MENAAKGSADIVLESVPHKVLEKITILCGRGNNGGDGYGVARHLTNKGCFVRLLQLGNPQTEDSITNASICEEMNIPCTSWDENICEDSSLIIDAIFGTGLDRVVEGVYAEAITAVNKLDAPCISLDIPSGLHCDTGVPLGCCIQAFMTLSFVGMKLGFSHDVAKDYLGEVEIVDIGCPINLLREYGSDTSK